MAGVRRQCCILVVVFSFFSLLSAVSIDVEKEDGSGSDWLYPLPIFNCTHLPIQPKATNVNQLRFQDITAFMSVGDSISAGFGLYSRRLYDPLDLVEYRGKVWHSGADDDAFSVFNFMKFFNPNITGGSVKKSSPLDVIKWREHKLAPWNPKIDHLNGAQSEAKVEDVPAQVDYLTEQLLTNYNSTVDFDNDWKLLNIFIGANNLCFSCLNATNTTAQYYGETLDYVIQKVYDQIPRVFINVMPIFNISQVYNISDPDPYCHFLWNTIFKDECPCLQGNATNADRLALDVNGVEYNKQIYAVAEKWQSLNDPYFTVKVQPFLINLHVPNLDYLSNVDCFHPSYLADYLFAVGLWNSMQLPPEEKLSDIVPSHIRCPGVDTYMQ